MADYERGLNRFLTEKIFPEDRAHVEYMLAPFRAALRAGKSPQEAMATLSPVDMDPDQMREAIQRQALRPGQVDPEVFDLLQKHYADMGVREGVSTFMQGMIEPLKGLYNVPWALATQAIEDPKYGLLKALGGGAVSPIMHGGKEVLGGIEDIRQGDMAQGLARAGLGAVEALSLPAMFVPPISPLLAGAAMGASAAGLHGLQKYRETGELPVSTTLGEATTEALLTALGGGRGTPTNVAERAAEIASAPFRTLTRGVESRLPLGRGFRAGVIRETVLRPEEKVFQTMQKSALGRSLWPTPAATEPYVGQIGALGHLSQMLATAKRFKAEIPHPNAPKKSIGTTEFLAVSDPYTGSQYIVNPKTGDVFDTFPENVTRIRESTLPLQKPLRNAEELAGVARGLKEILWKRYEKLFLEPFGDIKLTKADFDAIRQGFRDRTDLVKEDLAVLQKTYGQKNRPFETIGEAQQRLRVLNAELEKYYKATREKPAVPSSLQINTRAMQAEADILRNMLAKKVEELVELYPERVLSALSPEARAALPDIATLTSYVKDLPRNYGEAKMLAANLAGKYRLGWEGLPPGEETELAQRFRIGAGGLGPDIHTYAPIPREIRKISKISPRNVSARAAGKMLISLPELSEMPSFRVPVPEPGGPIGRFAGHIAAREALSAPTQAGRYQIEKKQKEE
jgi:hypothetical protein